MSRIGLFALVVWFWSAAATPAHAYLDPGSGSLVVQGLLVGSAGILVAIKLLWHRLRSLVGLGRRTPESAPEE